ncbi:MAG: DNA polymerase I [Oscillatoriaceae bacterium SKW80]|nr:DNA polymerase I [Oscillatoriaceae bacterium SKW80]HIK27095.1 DNA polymerase I [Oscillatoriaceae cyanobacterium M7585_C2015_266]
MSANIPTFILIDGHSLAYRSYYAYAKGREGGLRTSTGIPTSVCYGFLTSLLSVMQAHKPEYMASAFDRNLPTFRHEADNAYKANRVDTPATEFIEELKNLEELLKALNVPVVTSPGYEADDILGTLARRASEAGYRVKILSGDRDLFQLVDTEKNISVLYFTPSKGSTPIEMGAEEIKEKLGILPTQIVDYKALCGDASDNIPGIKGIGEKTAVKLLTEYGSLDGIYAALPQIKGTTQKKLAEGKDAAYHSRHLAQIVLDVPLEIDLADCKLQGFDHTVIEPIFRKLEFQKYLKQLEQLQQQFGGGIDKSQKEEKETEGLQLSLFNQPQTEKTAETTVKEAVPIKPQIIDTPEKLTKLVKHLQNFTNPDNPVAWDTETTDLEPRDAKLVGIGCCWGTGAEDVAYIPIAHTKGKQLDLKTVLETLRPILEGDCYCKVLHNTKFDRLVLLCQEVKLKGVVFDTMLASYVINPEEKHNLSDLSNKYLKKEGVSKNYKSLNIPKGKTIADLDILTVADYCGMDVYATFLLLPKLQKKLEEAPKLRQVFEIEMRLEPVLAEMEYTGIRIDTDYLKELSEQHIKPQLAASEKQAIDAIPRVYLKDYIEKIWQNIEGNWGAIAKQDFDSVPSAILKAYLKKISKNTKKNLAENKEKIDTATVSELVNLNSPAQLSELLFEILKLNKKKSRKTKTGIYSTDVTVLENLQGNHPIIDALLEYRMLHKLYSTYVEGILQRMRADTQRLHTEFNQTFTETGRLSSSDPNLQNIPIGTEFSRQIRKAFLPETGWLMVSADYSQIELRILAHLSQEPVLIEAYQNNRDVHSVTAQLLFEKETVTSEERRLGKTINFGVIYGMGSARFARALGKTTAEGKVFIERFYKRYPKVFEYLEMKKKEAIALGYVETIIGRRRYFKFEGKELQKLKGKQPEEINLKSLKLTQFDAQLLRAAANAPIQGSSADIIKIAMVRLHEILQNYQARLLLQVHDELVFEMPPCEWEELQLKIKSVMETALPLSVPLLVDVRAGQNWMDAK